MDVESAFGRLFQQHFSEQGIPERMRKWNWTLAKYHTAWNALSTKAAGETVRLGLIHEMDGYPMFRIACGWALRLPVEMETLTFSWVGDNIITDDFFHGTAHIEGPVQESERPAILQRVFEARDACQYWDETISLLAQATMLKVLRSELSDDLSWLGTLEELPPGDCDVHPGKPPIKR